MNKAVSALAILCALSATIVCHKLLLKHMTGTSGASWFEAGCSESSEEGGADCAAVLASPYSYIPPKFDDEPADQPHIPAAFAGMVYYSVLTVWLLGIGRPSRSQRWLHLLPLLLAVTGLLFSTYFLSIMFNKLDEWCSWCVVTHALNGLIAVCLVLMWPWRKRKTEKTAAPDDQAKDTTIVPAVMPAAVIHPSGRVVLMTAIGIVLALMANYQLMAKEGWAKNSRNAKKGYDLCMVALKRVSEDPAKLVKLWREARKWDIAIRPDDPMLWEAGVPGHALQLVIFSDLQCPVCKRVGDILDTEVRPLFDGNLQIVFKHFPLNPDCNPDMQRRMHEYACDGARIAEAARLIGGNDAFWLAHNAIFARQSELTRGKLTAESVAEQIGLDPTELAAAILDPKVDRRIMQDVAEGRFHDVGGTPSVFLDGRLIDTLARKEINFWDRIADIYWKNRRVPRPESTKLSSEAATRDSLDQPAAP